MKEFVTFGIKEARAAIFAGSFFVLLFISNRIPLFGLARYDFLFLAAIAIQAVLYLSKMETRDEVKVNFTVLDCRVRPINFFSNIPDELIVYSILLVRVFAHIA
jgi:uncharacterized membrane protein YoaT (DUF817 family)